MSFFDLDKFTVEPSVELLNSGKKTDLLNLAKHYKLSEIKSSMRKHEIKNISVQYFVHEEIFNENALFLIVDVQSVSSSKVKGYELVPEAYRKKIRNCKKDSNQTHVKFARNKEQLFDRWCCSKKIDQNNDKVRQLVFVEEFKRCIQSDVKTFLDEKQVETLEEAARLADDYYLTHKVSFIAKPKPTSSHPQNKFMSGNSSGMPSQSNTPKLNSSSETKSQYPLSRPTCNYCKKPGYLVSECLKLKR